MRTIIITLLLIICMAQNSSAGAQNNHRRPTREQFAQKQAETLISELKIDDVTAQKFRELYLKCQKEIWESHREKKGTQKSDNITEEEAQQIIKNRFAHQVKMQKIQEKYYKEYSKILSQRQILLLYDKEHKLMERMMMRKNNRREKKH